MKFYPCIIATTSELQAAGIPLTNFKNGRLRDRSIVMAIEDYCGRPVVSIRQAAGNTDEILILTADGYIQRNRISNKRTVVLFGELESLKNVLADIIEERPDEDPYDVFCSYSYQTGINVQLGLDDWIREQYGKK